MSELPPPGIAIPQRQPSPSPAFPGGAFSASPASSLPKAQTPSSLYNQNPFDFQVPSIPPRLSRVGRRISEMGMNVLVGPDLPDEAPVPRRDPLVKAGEVPGMGDEPIMCPFCEKPLPPAFILTQMAHNHASSQEKKRVVERKASVTRRPGTVSRSASGSGPPGMSMSRVLEDSGVSVPMGSTASAPGSARPSISGDVRQQPNGSLTATKSASDITTDALLESTRPKPGEVLPKATAESLLPMVKSAETADTAGASSIISPDDVRKWSSLAGIDLSSSSPAPSSLGPSQPEKAIPAIPPPPPPSSTISDRLKKPDGSTSSSSKFGGFFGRKARDEDSDDEEGSGATGGYAKLSGPPSPDRAEAPSWRAKAKAKAESEDVAAGRVAEVAKVEPTPADLPKNVASDEALKTLLVEVLGKVNSMSKSHEDLLHSHTTLLTSLKIARSNLAMAEANSEMLEEQLKRAPPPTARPGPQPQSTTSTRPSTPSTAPAATLPSRSLSSIPSIIIPPGRKSLEENRSAHPVAAPRRSEDSRPARPQSMIMPPPNMYNNGPSTGPASSTAGKESKGMFGFLGGGKTKVPGLGTIVIPSAREFGASAVRFGDAIASGPTRPGTPQRESGQFFDYHTPSAYGPVQNDTRQRTVSGDNISRAPSPNPSLNTPRGTPGQSPSATSSLQSPPTGPVRPQPISPALSAELAKLRTAYTTSQTRMEAMNKELTELKKGKVEMEAELESLSQALFEEANKMVSDERKRRVEVEENLKEVKEEREALRETIKVLGGQSDIGTESEGGADDDSEVGVARTNDIVPRDLDKHYEALRKTIHHVADGTAPSAAFESAVGTDEPLGGGRKISAASTEANPWAEVDFGTGAAGSLGRNFQEATDEVDPLAKSAGAAAEMERGG